jgi:hypothetical protein
MSCENRTVGKKKQKRNLEILEMARLADFNFDKGRLCGIITAACFFIGKDRADITRALLHWYGITRETVERILQDGRTKDFNLKSLDRVGAWENIPAIDAPIK